eukprot:297801_1
MASLFKTMRFFYLLLLCVISISESYQNNYKFEFINNGILNNEITYNNQLYIFKEISSCSSKPNKNTLFCIGDNNYRHIIEFEYDPNHSNNNLQITNIFQLEKSPNEEYMDIESLIYLSYNNKEFFMIITEGNREFNRQTHIYLYNIEGLYINELNYPNEIFQENYQTGCWNNECIQASDIWLDQNDTYWLIMATESPLYQDRQTFDNALSIRIMVARILFNATDIHSIAYDHAFVYDLQAPSFRLKDIIIINDNLDMIVMEMKSVTQTINGTASRDAKLYFSSNMKQINNRSNVLNNCSTLYSSQCNTSNKIQKRLLFEFKSSSAITDDRCELSIQHFDALTLLKYDHKVVKESCIPETVVIISDSDDEISHYIIGHILQSKCKQINEYDIVNCTFGNITSNATNTEKPSRDKIVWIVVAVFGIIFVFFIAAIVIYNYKSYEPVNEQDIASPVSSSSTYEQYPHVHLGENEHSITLTN